jgi:hypothetical protein
MLQLDKGGEEDKGHLLLQKCCSVLKKDTKMFEILQKP